ncbi:MAG: hypothetical protein RH917_08355 [Lacipirellulaceae bacterium]
MSVKELETAISQLSKEEFAELSHWFAEFQAQAWDKQIEQDLNSGKLDALINEVDAEIAAGKAKPL